MNRGVACAIFKTINHEKWTDIERATAIIEVIIHKKKKAPYSQIDSQMTLEL